ncbi:MAG: hypothetical protein ABSD27_12990, partial [Bryobacteraceae bacterium]
PSVMIPTVSASGTAGGGTTDTQKECDSAVREQEKPKDVLPLQQIGASGSTIETVSRCALLGSAALYGIGLLIANFSAQLYGRYTLGLVEAQYVLVGMLWMALTLLSFALTRSGMRWLKAHGPWRGRLPRSNLKNALSVTAAWLGLLGVYLQVVAFLGLGIDAYWSWGPWLILAILVFTNLTLGALFQETWQDMNRRSQPGDSFMVKLWKADSIQISKRILYFFIALSLYSVFLYPHLSPAVGGGKLHEAEIIIRQDRRSLFEGMPEFRLDKSGRLGPVAIVAESEQALIVTGIDTSWWKHSRRSLHLKKDLIDLVIYIK